MRFAVAALAIVGLIALIWRYRAEAIVALYANGLTIFFLVTHFLGIHVPTIATGVFDFGLGMLACMIYLFKGSDGDPSELPKRPLGAWLAMFVLFLMWFTLHMLQRPTTHIVLKAEYYKWAYGITYWALALLVGLLFPCSIARVHRLLRAIAILGLTMSAVMLMSYFAGLTDVSESWEGARYSISAKVGALGYAHRASISAAALLGGFMVAQGKKLSRRRIIFVLIAMLVFFGTVVLGGTRSSVIAILLGFLVAAGTFRFRYFPLGLGLMIILGIIGVFVIVPMLPAAGVQRVFSYATIAEGFQNRKDLLIRSLDILRASPAFGRTTGFETVVFGFAYSHNFTVQVLIETGLVGFPIYVGAWVGILARWVPTLKNRASISFQMAAPIMVMLVVVLFEAHAHGELSNHRLWLLVGILAGHSPAVFRTIYPGQPSTVLLEEMGPST